MRIAVPKETKSGELRVALVPDIISKLTKAGLEVIPATNLKGFDEYVQGVGSQREIIRWSFNKDTEIGDVKRFEVTNVGHIIAKLKKVNEKGLMAAEEARPQVEPLLKNKKKEKNLYS